MLFSHGKISSFRAKAHLVFRWWLYNKEMSSIQYLLSLAVSFQKLEQNQSRRWALTHWSVLQYVVVFFFGFVCIEFVLYFRNNPRLKYFG